MLEAALSCVIDCLCDDGDIRGCRLGMSQIGGTGSPTSTPHGNRETRNAENTGHVECDFQKGYLLTVFQMFIFIYSE